MNARSFAGRHDPAHARTVRRPPRAEPPAHPAKRARAVRPAGGYKRIPIRAIAEDAEISQWLLYHYFRGKDDLLREIFLQTKEAIRDSFSRAAPDSAPADRLESLIRSSFEVVREIPEFWKLSHGLRMQPGVLQGLAQEVAAGSAAIRTELEQLLRAAGVPNPSIESYLLFAQIDGVAQHFSLDPERYPLEPAADAISARYRQIASPPEVHDANKEAGDER